MQSREKMKEAIEIWVAGVKIHMNETEVYNYIFKYYKDKGYSDDDATNVAKKVVEREKKRHSEELE